MEWTGWGLVSGFENTDDIFDEHKYYFNDTGSWMDSSWRWWLNGFEPGTPLKLVSGGGNYWPGETWSNYYHNEDDDPDVLSAIDSYLCAGYGVGIGIFNGGHAITVWGFNYDSNYDKNTNPEDYYLGIWVSDSDSDKGNPTPPDRLSYFEVSWNSTANWWYMPNYGGGWMISRVQALEPYPSGRPIADAGGPYVVDEGTPVSFDASGSVDAESDTIYYRWDFEEDGTWDTGWSLSSSSSYTWWDDYAGDAELQILADQLYDVDQTTVIVNNVAPTITVTGDTINEGDTATIHGTITDPGILDDFTLTVNWGDGSPTEIKSYPAGTSSFTLNHQYTDDDPSTTPSDTYTVTVTVKDDDDGSDTEKTTVVVNNVDPSITVTGDTIDEEDEATITGTILDPSLLDTYNVIIDWGEGAPEIIYYPSGTTSFTLTHQYLDDNPTATASDTYTVSVSVTDDDTGNDMMTAQIVVNNEDTYIDTITLDQPNKQFILPTVHALNFTANFTDTGTQDTHTATWEWGDTTQSPGLVEEAEGKGNITGQHTFTAPGVYTVTLTVYDDDTSVVSDTIEVIVVTVEEALQITNDYIQGLPDDAFLKNAKNRKKSLDNMFSAIQNALADMDYNGVIQNLRNNVREKADGTVDGSLKNDWIIDPAVQKEICQKIDDITAYLETLI